MLGCLPAAVHTNQTKQVDDAIGADEVVLGTPSAGEWEHRNGVIESPKQLTASIVTGAHVGEQVVGGDGVEDSCLEGQQKTIRVAAICNTDGYHIH